MSRAPTRSNAKRAGSDGNAEQTRSLKVADILLPPHQVRKHYDPEQLAELAASIKRVGLLQPIVVRPHGEQWELIAGSRRLAAHELLKEPFILARIVHVDDQAASAAMLTENIQRADLTPLEEAQAVRALVDIHGWGQPETGRRLGKSSTWVRDRLDILRLPPDLAEALDTGKIAMGAALELAKINNEQVRSQYVFYAISSGITVSEAKRWREQYEADVHAGQLYNADESSRTPEYVYTPAMVRCTFCLDEIELGRAKIMHVCELCTTEIHQTLRGDHGRDATSDTDTAGDRPLDERDSRDRLADNGHGQPE